MVVRWAVSDFTYDIDLNAMNTQSRMIIRSLVSDIPATTPLIRLTLCPPKYNHNGGCMESIHRKELMSSSLSPYSSNFCGAYWLELTSGHQLPEEEIVDLCYPAASWISFFYSSYYC